MDKTETGIWHVLYTKPRWEQKIAGRLAAVGLESYCPMNKVERNWSDRRKIVYEPLFRCYVFVKVDRGQLLLPLHIPGVFQYVNQMGKPAPVREKEINCIRRFLAEHSSVRLEKIAVGVRDRVEILYGPFMDLEGQVTHVSENHVKVMLESLGYSLVASVKKSSIRKVLQNETQLV